MPTLILHGEDDQIVPIGAAALQSAKLVKNATLKTYPGFPHGMPTTHSDQINADLSRIRQEKPASSSMIHSRRYIAAEPMYRRSPPIFASLGVWVIFPFGTQ